MPIVLALFSALAYGVSDYCGGRAARSTPTFVVTLVAQLTTVTLTGTIVAVLADPFPAADDVAWSIGAGIASTTGVTAFYYALANGAMTVVAPVTAVISAVVPVATGVALGERPTALALTGVALAIVAVGLVSGVGGRAERSTPAGVILMAVVAGIGFGMLFVFLDRTSDESEMWPLFIAQLTSLPIVITAVVARRLTFPPPRRLIGVMVLAGLLAVSANVAYLVATRKGLLSLVAVITSLYPASTVALATVLDQERMSSSQAVGIGLAVGALGLVTAGS
jgi:drug/metabolite transporter (DMT)-like permease